MMDKKGLSDIVTNVLIILLVLAAVTIVWFFVKPLIERSASSVSGVNDCFTVDVVPTACNIPALTGTVTVKRNVGSGVVTMLKIVGHTATDSQAIDFNLATATPPIALTELQSATSPTLTFSFNPDYVTVAPVIDAGNGQTKICQESTTKINC